MYATTDRQTNGPETDRQTDGRTKQHYCPFPTVRGILIIVTVIVIIIISVLETICKVPLAEAQTALGKQEIRSVVCRYLSYC